MSNGCIRGVFNGYEFICPDRCKVCRDANSQHLSIKGLVLGVKRNGVYIVERKCVCCFKTHAECKNSGVCDKNPSLFYGRPNTCPGCRDKPQEDRVCEYCNGKALQDMYCPCCKKDGKDWFVPPSGASRKC